MKHGRLPAIVWSSSENNGFHENKTRRPTIEKGIRHVNGYIHLPQFHTTSTRFDLTMDDPLHCRCSLGCQRRSGIGISRNCRFFKSSTWRRCSSSSYGPHNRYSGIRYRDSYPRAQPYDHCSPCTNASISIRKETLPMKKLTIHYIRYALALLVNVGFRIYTN
jgi:hypothetical protein